MSTLSLAMIVKNEGSTIERVLGCARTFCDEMIVVDTGSTDDTVAKARAMGAITHDFTWIDDFAAARNEAFSRCTQDWIIWLDGDDLVSAEHQARMRELKHTTLDSELEAVYLRYDYRPFMQWRERIVRRDLFGTQLIWREPVHEVIHGIDARKAKHVDTITIVHDTPPERHALKSDRNLKILRRHCERGARDDRSLYLYAVECLHSLCRDEGERALERFFAFVEHPAYRYEVNCKTYDFLMHFDQPLRALAALSRAIVDDPARAEAYYKLGRHFLDKVDRPAAAIPLLTVASAIGIPGQGIPEMEAYTFGPWELLCRAYFRLERFDVAREMARKAVQHPSPHGRWFTELAESDAFSCGEPIPAHWQEWTDSNLARQVPRCQIIRLLEESGFSAAQIVAAVRSTGRTQGQ